MGCVEAVGGGGGGWFQRCGVGGDRLAVGGINIVFVCFEAFLLGLGEEGM